MKKRFFLRSILTLFLALSSLGAFGPASAASQMDDISVQLEALQPTYTATEAVQVQVTISNNGNQPVKVLKWFTPSEELEEPLFIVSLNGLNVPYTGATYKRPAPKAEDYIQLKAGESLVRLAPLSEFYDFSTSGRYTLRYEAQSEQLFSTRGSGFLKKTDSLSSNTVEVYVEGRAPKTPEDITPEVVTGTTSYNKCTSTQQSLLATARSEASNYSTGALDYLSAGKTGNRFITWFGQYDATRYGTVTAHFSAISNAMDTKPVTFDCSCKKNYYAYVYSNKPYVIYLCKVFWNVAPMTGTDSKAGTLIHEMSHFSVVASTLDYVYGQSGAINLALTKPDNAIKNADNHEYFAENNPFLP